MSDDYGGVILNAHYNDRMVIHLISHNVIILHTRTEIDNIYHIIICISDNINIYIFVSYSSV